MKKLNITVFSFLFAILFTGNAMAANLQFKEGFEAPGDKLSKWRGIQVKGRENLEFVTSHVRKGKHALKLSISANQGKVAGGVRSEILYDHKDQPGSETWYAWSIMVPENFKDAPHHLFQAMGQWHDQPNREKGQTWANYPRNSPSIAVYFATRQASKIPPKLRAKVKNFDQYVRNGTISGFSIHAGLKKKGGIFTFVPILKGEWNDMMFHIKWSMGRDGFVEVFHNGQFVARKEGRNMWNDYSHYLKLGIYRSPKIRHASHVFYDEVRIGKTREAVSIASDTSGSLMQDGNETPLTQSTPVVSETPKALNNLRKGDRVVTQGGIHGIVRQIQNDFVILEIARNVKIRINRAAIVDIR